MEVITVESSIWKKLVQRLNEIEQLIMSLKTKDQSGSKIIPLVAQTAYIRVTEAIKKYGVNRTTLNNYCKEYNIRRLPSGKENLMNELDLIEALRQGRKTPLEVVFSRKKHG